MMLDEGLIKSTGPHMKRFFFKKKSKSCIAVLSEHKVGTPRTTDSNGGIPNPSAKEGKTAILAAL